MGPRVPHEMNLVSDLALKEMARVKDIIHWSWTHEKFMFYDWLASVLRLLEFVYDVEAFMVPRRPVTVTTRFLVDRSPPATNTLGATPIRNKPKLLIRAS